MCGIAGCLHRSVAPAPLREGLDRMLTALVHRGPDDRGVWLDADLGLALGHRRLSIRDLSAAGHQPMFTDDGAWGLVYNGEIYNAGALRHQLGNSRPWRGRSDTEVLLRAIETWGLPATLARAAGMFAMAVWNRSARTVTLIRDRLGIKPLYYSVQDGRVWWASELKALLAHPSYRAEVDPRSLRLFLRFGYVSAPHCILQRTWKLCPGSYLEFDIDSPAQPRHHVYWDAAEVARQARANATKQDEPAVLDEARTRLTEIVEQHLVSDVPVGAFLSGGIDSSLVVAMMQAQSPRPIKTFSIGFHDPRFDEAPYARQIADILGTDHCEHYVDRQQVAEAIPHWPEHYCEPFSDTSCLPSQIICRLARQHVTVALTGDGGDELFGGYRRYHQAQIIQQRLRCVPRAVRQSLRGLLAVPPPAVYRRLQPLQRWLAGSLNDGISETARKTRSLLGTRNQQELYECLASISFNANASGLVTPDANRSPAGPRDADQRTDDLVSWQPDWEMLDNMQLWDSQTYLPNDILHKVDIASMSVGLEVRVPLLDHRFYEFAWQVPNHLKVAKGRGKWLLRRLLSDYVPNRLFDRPKRGFSAPLDDSLRGPLRDWAESLLQSDTLQASGLLQAQRVASYWDDLLARRAGHARIWPVLVFLAWQQHYLRPNHEYRICNSSDDSLCVGRES
jgi:asparagine synthase (glutamine-hydrolysing)